MWAALEPPPTHSGHLRERYALFTIIVLGESFVKTLTELADSGISPRTEVFGLVVFAIGIALWWTYFDDIAESAIRRSVGPLRSAGSVGVAWVYAHLPLAAGLTAFGVAAKKVVGLESFDEPMGVAYMWLLAGSIAAALVAAAGLDALTVSPHFGVAGRLRVGSRLVAAVVLLATAAASVNAPAIVFCAVVAAVTVAQIGVEVITAARADRSLDREVASDVTRLAGSCDHLAAGSHTVPAAVTGCPRCEELGMTWVRLRVCDACGRIGCCDDSTGRHARQHHAEEGHPVMASVEPGEDWAYCFVDDVVEQGWTADPVRG